jgi:hypothetical protein
MHYLGSERAYICLRRIAGIVRNGILRVGKQRYHRDKRDLQIGKGLGVWVVNRSLALKLAELFGLCLVAPRMRAVWILGLRYDEI